jgi:L-lactate dehydrogenase (cytochrome)
MAEITCIEDLRRLARKRVPRMFYDYVDGGSWTEYTYRANEEDFGKIEFRQRVAVDITERSTASTMVGQPVSMPTARSWRRARRRSSAYRSPCRP